MKQVINVGIGGRSFIIDEDAYVKLDAYLKAFKSKVQMGYQTKEVLEEVEFRIAELFSEYLIGGRQVVNLAIVEKVINQLGYPDGSRVREEELHVEDDCEYQIPSKKFYRDPDRKIIAGICSGFAYHFGVEVGIVRILFLVALFCGSFGFWVYLVVWIVAPLAKSASEKCEMRGLPITAENLRKFSSQKNI